MRRKKKFRTMSIAGRSEKIGRRRLAKAVVKYAVLTLCGIVLFKWGQAAAFEQRGYMAYGGECLLLALPLFYYLISATVRDMAVDIKEIFKDGGNDDD